MGLKNKNKVSAEFNMSSLTDIIFLLLIFFMLTSNLVSPNAMKLDLPGDGGTATINSDDPPEITISRSGDISLDGVKLRSGDVEKAMLNLKREYGKSLMVLIAPSENAPVEQLILVMDIANKYKIKAIPALDAE